MASRSWPALDIALVFPDDRAARDLILAALDDFHPTAIEDGVGSLRAFFQTDEARDAAAQALTVIFTGPQLQIAPIDLPDEGWAERSQASLHAVRIGGLTVAPPWDLPTDDTPVIAIQPSMGFGTGHHASTRLCLRAMQTLALQHADAIDVGTGSGILAIAAVTLGAVDVLAIDSDQDALDSARDNLARNGVADRVTLTLADIRDVRRSPVALVMANLTGALLRSAAERLLRVTRQGGHLVLGGFLLAEEDVVVGSFAPPARMIWRAEEDDWVAVILRKEGASAMPRQA